MCWLSFITPTALVQLASMCHLLSSCGKRPTLRFMDQQVLRYLLRMQFVDAVSDVADFDPKFRAKYPEKFSSWIGGNPMVMEVTPIHQSDDVQNVVNKLVVVLQQELGYFDQHAFNAAIAVSEIGQNVYQHNGGAPGFVAMQAYRNREGRRLEIGISDAGIGLAATLNRNRSVAAVTTDQNAVRRAIQMGASEFDDPSRGRGLPLLINMVAGQGGTVHLRSGSALSRYNNDRGAWEREVPHLAGVHVSLILPDHSA